MIAGAAGVAAAALICLDPGHGTPAAIGRQVEPIGPGSKVMKIKDGGGARGEAAVALAIAKRTRTLLLARGYRVAMTRTGPTIRLGNGNGNIARAKFCNRRHAALMVRIHADGSDRPLAARRLDARPRLAPRLDGRHLRAEPRAPAARSRSRSSLRRAPPTAASSGAPT